MYFLMNRSYFLDVSDMNLNFLLVLLMSIINVSLLDFFMTKVLKNWVFLILYF